MPDLLVPGGTPDSGLVRADVRDKDHYALVVHNRSPVAEGAPGGKGILQYDSASAESFRSNDSEFYVKKPATFDGAAVFNALVRWKEGATVASGSSITLGDDGNAFPISGTSAISTITAKAAGVIVFLRFTSTAVLVPGGNLLGLPGEFLANVGASCQLYSDGTNWLFVSGQGNKAFAARVHSTSTSTLTAGGEYVTFHSGGVDYDPAGMWASGNPRRLTPNVSGLYAVTAVGRVSSDVDNDFEIQIHKNGSLYQRHSRKPDLASGSSGDSQLGAADTILLDSNDYVELFIDRPNGDAGTIDTESTMSLWWLGHP